MKWIRDNWFKVGLLALGLLIFVFSWYWYSYRPELVRKSCFDKSVKFDQAFRLDLTGDALATQEAKDTSACISSYGIK